MYLCTCKPIDLHRVFRRAPVLAYEIYEQNRHSRSFSLPIAKRVGIRETAQDSRENRVWLVTTQAAG